MNSTDFSQNVHVSIYTIHLQLTLPGLNIILTGSESDQAYMEVLPEL